MSPYESNLESDQLNAIEGRLAGTLRPVSPPSDFVQRLRSRIHLPEGEKIALRIQDWERLMLLIGGVLSGAVVVLTVARAFYHLFGRRSG